MTWDQIESKLAVGATWFIVLFFVGTIFVFVAEEYYGTPLSFIRQAGMATRATPAPSALKPQSNERASQIDPSPTQETILKTQLAPSRSQRSVMISDPSTMTHNGAPSERSRFAPPAPPIAGHPDPPPGDAIAEAKRKVLQAIETWRRAWQAQDVETYLAHYIATFEPANGHSHQAWLQDRQIKLTRAQAISVQIDHLQVQRVDDQRWTATFDQHYQSTTYADKVTKELLLIKVGDLYLIEKERAW